MSQLTANEFWGEDPLERAKKHIFEPRRFEKGSECPCCGQFVKLYRRKLNAGMARMLLWLACTRVAKNTVWIHPGKQAPPSLTRSHDWYGLEHFQLAEVRRTPADTKSGTKRTSGWWRPTKKGIDFAARRDTSPTHAHVFNGEVMGFSSEHFGIEEALGSEFSYRELMQSWMNR